MDKKYIVVDGFTNYLTDGRGNYWGYTDMKIEREETEDGVKFKLVQYFGKITTELVSTKHGTGLNGQVKRG